MSKVGKKKQIKKISVINPKAVIGHNGQVIPGLVALVDELLGIDKQVKALGKAARDLRNRAKTEFSILSGPLAHELRLRKMDVDARVQFESSHEDLKTSLGYQPSIDFNGAEPTKASAEAQPSDAKLANKAVHEDQDDDEGFEVEEDAEEADTDDEDDEGTGLPDEVPANLRRSNKIEREG